MGFSSTNNNEILDLFNTSRKKRAVNNFMKGYDIVDDCTLETDYTYIDMHSYKAIDYICIDYDHTTLNRLYDLSHYPEPNIIVKSKKSSKYHLIYLLNRPVYINGHSAPLQKFQEIRRNLTHLLDGDKSYNNIYMYNLFNSAKYETTINNNIKYNFDDFYEYFDVEDFNVKDRKSTITYAYDIEEFDVFPIGMRNTLLFQEMRKYAYKNYMPSHVQGFDLLDRVCSFGIQLNDEYSEIPFNQNQIISIAKSILLFITRTFSHSAYHSWIAANYSSERQAYRGRRKNLTSRLKGEIYILSCLLHDKKPIAKMISDTFDCSLRTAYKWISRCRLIKREYHIDKLREDDDYERNFLLNYIDKSINPIKLQTFNYPKIPQHEIDSMGLRHYTKTTRLCDDGYLLNMIRMTRMEKIWYNNDSKDIEYHQMLINGEHAAYEFEKGKDWIYIVHKEDIIIVENHPMFSDPKYHTIEGTNISSSLYKYIVSGKPYIKPSWKVNQELNAEYEEHDRKQERIRMNKQSMPALEEMMRGTRVQAEVEGFLGSII